MDPNGIADLSSVSPQQIFLESHPEKPAASSTLYLNRFTNNNSDQSQNHTVAGVHVVLKKDDPNGLWNALHVDRGKQKLDPKQPKVATRTLLICCDTLEVHGEFCLPEADVAVFARQLVWTTPDAAINTSPLDWSVAKAEDGSDTQAGQNGAAGRHAGSLRIFLSALEPAQDNRPRLIARGGPGPHPGLGKDGNPGKSMRSWSSKPFGISHAGITASKATVNFSPPAVYIDYEWVWGVRIGSGKEGDNSFPSNGSNAQPPGIPGNGGNGGGLTTNVAEAVKRFLNPAGKAGDKGRDYSGGSAGEPSNCAKYKVKLFADALGTDNAKHEVSKTDSKSVVRGNDATAEGPKRGDGSAPQAVMVDEANAWLHPLGLQKALEYARDLFLAGARTELEALLLPYEAALSLPTPAKTGAWDDGVGSQWTAAQSEVAAMLQRLRGHLDYFGNAAGYTPLLSLAGSFALYQEETHRALRTLMLAHWIGSKELTAQETAAALGDAIDNLNQDTRLAATQVVAAEEKVGEVVKRMDALEQELSARGQDLAELRTHLLGQAENDLQQQARIKFAIKMAAALCQVIPIGQPALGAVGSLGSVAADFIGGDAESAPDTVSKMGDVIKKARAAAKKAEAAKKKAKKEKEKSEESGDAKSAKDKASGWAQVGDGLGPALSQVSGALKALQVPAAEVEAELQRLASENDAWKELVKKITVLNERKAAFAADLIDALQSLGDSYARIADNTAAVFSMQQERAKHIGKLDPAATGFVRQMGQRSRISLLKYLYLMVKAYETTVFKPIDVDWKLSEIGDKIAKLLEPEQGFNAATLDQHINVVEPLYQANLDTARQQLLSDFSFHEKTLPLGLGLSSSQTPEVLEQLNQASQVTLDPLSYGLVLSDYHLARISQVDLQKVEFDPAGPPLPDTTNLIVSLQPASNGTMRKAEWLYAVYSDEPLYWTWTCHSGTVKRGESSAAAKDILDLVLGEKAGNIRQKVALPPLWSDFRVKINYVPELPLHQRPRISKLHFEVSCDVSLAPAHQAVLKVLSLGSKNGAVIECQPDLAGRANGFNHMVRIYSKGANTRLKAPAHLAGAAFEAWDLVGQQLNQMGVKQPEIGIPLNDNVLAQCHWRRAPAQPAVPRLKSRAATTLGEEAPRGGLILRITAAEDAPVVGMVPSLNDAELLAEGQGDWRQVNYQGMVGWVNA